jgi:hypothetical protein
MMRRILNAPGGKRLFLFPRLITVLGFWVFLTPDLYAAGRRQINTQVAEGVDIWQQEFTVSNLKPGRYNIIINAKDAAGNVGVSGPFNIQVDPLAGLPEARLIYPEAGMVIRGDVNMVGVTTARYGVKQVQVKMDGGEYAVVEGLEYWSQSIPADSIVEGKHSIYVRAIDSKELVGPEIRVDFTLDLTPPVVELTNHAIGDLVSGNIKVQGRIDDPNGILSAAVSSDGENFKPLFLRSKRGDPGRHFTFPVRTKGMEDGPVVYYVRAIDKTGYATTKPFLFFVDNKGPEIEILSPELNEDTYGRTQVTGRVIDTVGLTQFYYEWAGERVDIPLRPGDPFWAATFPISMANNRAIPFRVTAVDKSGNVTTKIQRFQDTRRFRTPTIIIDYPPRGDLGSLSQDAAIYGHIAPGFFPYAVILEGEIEYIMAQSGFRIPPEMIPNGRNTLRMWAVDEEDTTGQPFTLRVNKPAPGGDAMVEVTTSSLTIDSPEEYSWFNESVTVRGSIDDYTPTTRLEYRLGPEDSWKPVTLAGRGSFSETIGLSGIEEGYVHLELRTVRDGRSDVPYYLPINKFSTMPSITFLTPAQKYGAIHGNVTTAGMLDYFVPISDVSYSMDGGITYEELSFTAKAGRAWFNYLCDYSALNNSKQQLIIRAMDRAGNEVEASPDIVFDNSTDFPIPIVNTPNDGDLVRGDFEISGLAFDDDGLSAVYWRILTPRNPWDTADTTLSRRASAEFQKVESAQNYTVPLTLADVKDGENIMELFAEDIYGTAGEVIRRVFKVSTAPPETVVTTPAIETHNRQNIMVRGTSFDLNGIEEILVSMDNGNSYQRADFVSSQEKPSDWSISLNTKAYADGVYSMLVRTVDKYGVSAFSNGLINIDNSPPEISLGSPNNGDTVGVLMSVTGQSYDNINLAGLRLQLVNINNPHIQIAYDLPAEFVIMEQMDLMDFPDGDYNLKISATDKAGNETSITRDVTVIKAKAASEVALYNPMPGIDHSGPIVVSGKITGALIPGQVTLMLNHQRFADIDVNRYGVFRYEFPDERIKNEELIVFSAAFMTPAGERISSYENEVRVSPNGPIIVVESHLDGDVITKRPWISGRAYIFDPGMEIPEPGAAPPEEYAVQRVELSFDNGRSFSKAKGGSEWKFRLETALLSPGPLPVIIKATFADGRVAVRRIILTVDIRPPVVRTIGPTENSSHRDTVLVYGSVEDNYDMDNVEVSLRPGDKAGYSVPGFIQGLYVDVNVLGGLNFTTGLGLTFFDDNVKLQVQAGQAPSGRYSGWIFGGKVLANIWTQNMSKYWGFDWEFWTMSLTLGAAFNYFQMEEGETPLVMGEFLGQWEIIKADMSYLFPNWKYFKSLSLYTEPGIWFAPSDVSSDEAWRTKFTIGFGFRASLF